MHACLLACVRAYGDVCCVLTLLTPCSPFRNPLPAHSCHRVCAGCRAAELVRPSSCGSAGPGMLPRRGCRKVGALDGPQRPWRQAQRQGQAVRQVAWKVPPEERQSRGQRASSTLRQQVGTADLRAGAFQSRKWKFREKIEADFGWVDSLRAKHTFCGNNPACTAEQRCVHQPIDVEFICWEKNDVQKNTV